MLCFSVEKPLTAENQQANARAACRALSPVALEHELVVFWRRAADRPASRCRAPRTPTWRRAPAGPTGGADGGHDPLLPWFGDQLPLKRKLATALTLIKVNPRRPGVREPDEADRAHLRGRKRRRGSRSEKGWISQARRRQLPACRTLALRERISGRTLEWMLEQRLRRHLRRRRGHPGHVHRRARAGRPPARGVEAVIDKDLASALLAADSRRRARIVTDVDAVYSGWGTPRAARDLAARPGAAEPSEFAEGRWDRRSAAAAPSSTRRAALRRSARSRTARAASR